MIQYTSTLLARTKTPLKHISGYRRGVDDLFAVLTTQYIMIPTYKRMLYGRRNG